MKKIIQTNIKAFTLLELLIVIGILSILATVVALVLNPAELLRQARDAKRIAEIKTIDDAIRFYTLNTNSPSYGTSSKIYLSLPDNNPDCSSYPNLPTSTLTIGWSYACKPESDYRKVNGTGWLPVNFSSLSIGSPLPILPADPINNDSYYYSYIPGSWVLTTRLQSEKYLTKTAQTDGGSDSARFETGTDLALWNTSGAGGQGQQQLSYQDTILNTSNLISYWKMDNNWNDSKGTNNGIGNGNAAIDNLVYKFGTGSGRGGMTDSDYVSAPASSDWYFGTGDYAVEIWFRPQNHILEINNVDSIIGNDDASSGTPGWMLAYNPGGTCHMGPATNCQNGSVGWTTTGNPRVNQWNLVGTTKLQTGQWYHIVATREAGTEKLYINGNLEDSWVNPNSVGNSSLSIYMLNRYHFSQNRADGNIDEVAVYSRALTATEITGHYSAL